MFAEAGGHAVNNVDWTGLLRLDASWRFAAVILLKNPSSADLFNAETAIEAVSPKPHTG
jgi:hypothetical protein